MPIKTRKSPKWAKFNPPDNESQDEFYQEQLKIFRAKWLKKGVRI